MTVLTALMTYGPAMTAKIFDAPTAAAPDPAAVPAVPVVVAPPAAVDAAVSSRDVLDRLDRILAVLESNRAAAALPAT